MKNLLRPNQILELEGEQATLQKDIQDSRAPIDRKIARKRLLEVEKTLSTYSPKDTTPEQRDKLDKRRKQLEEEIKVGMPSSEEMRKNPPGVVPRHIAWEKRNKHKVLEWKNIVLTLNKGNPDPDVADTEQLRPGTSYLSMDGAQIPGKTMSFPSEVYKENFDNIDWDGSNQPDPD